MKKNYRLPFFTFLATLLLFHISFAQSRIERIDSFYTHKFPGQINGGLLLAENGVTVYQKAFGMADFRSTIPNTSNTTYNLASISKVFTSTAILQLMEKKKLKLTDPVRRYLPGFPYLGITIFHLLCHTSGLPNLELYEDLVHRYPDSIIDNRSIIPELNKWTKPLPFAPGAKWQYSNTNFDLLAILIERVSRVSYAQYLLKYIFEPAGMRSSYVALSPKHAKGAIAHVYPNWYTLSYTPADSIARYRYINYNLGGLVGASNIITTMEDMLAFDKALFGGRLLKPATLELAFTPVRLTDGSIFQEGSMDTMLGEGKGFYGLGWSIYEQPGFGKSVGHGGFNYGLATFYVHRLQPSQTIIAYDNTAAPAFGKAVTSALHLLNDKQGIERVNKISLARIYGTTLKEKGIDQAVVAFNTFKSDTAHYYTSERELNWLGYDFLLRSSFEGHLSLALEVFKINTLLYPTSFNAYDSYAEALLKAGKKEEAVKMYEKSLQLNPDNKGAREALNKIK